MSAIVLFDQLVGATISGVWTYVSGPSSHPSPPGSYNGSINFASYDPGTYIYQYTVTSSGNTSQANVTVVWAGVGNPRLNEGCITAYNMSSFSVSPFSTQVSDDSRGVCFTGLQSPTSSVLAVPPEWGGLTYGGDLFYRIKVPSCTIGYTITVTVSGVGYANPAKGIGLQIYTACKDNDCVASNRMSSAASNSMQSSINASIQINSASSEFLYIRVASQIEGQYDVIVSSDFICTNIEPAPCEANTKVMGFAGASVWGFGLNNVFGS